MEKVKRGLESCLGWMENNIVMIAIRRGMVLSMPVLILSAMASTLKNMPITPWLDFLKSFAGGYLSTILTWTVDGTSGILSLIMIIAISYAYAAEVENSFKIVYTVCSVCSFMAFSAQKGEAPAFQVFSVTWMFTAIVVTLCSCGLLHFIFTRFSKIWQKLYAEGVDSYYQIAISSIIPVGIVVLTFGLLNAGITAVGGDPNIQNVGMVFCKSLFAHVGTGFPGTLLYIFLVQALWFFGIHGDNVLFLVTYIYFMPAVTLNQTLVSMGQAPTEIFSYPFFNFFVMMGGTGTTLCLLLAIFLVSKKPNNRRIAKISLFPGLFNINEPILWGFPVILNPIMFVPFLAVPILSMFVSALAMKMGIVPVAIFNESWTMPLFFSGYRCTGSIAGAVLQAVNLAVGTAVYIPFVRMYEKRQTERLKETINQLDEIVMEGEESEMPVMLLSGNDRLSTVASMLVDDLHYAMKKGDVKLFYQPQIKSDGSILGAEALLRWKHPVLDDYIYPPLVIELAREDGYLDELGLYIIDQAAATLERIAGETREPIKISVNISAAQLENPSFCDEVIAIMNKYDFKQSKLAIEITEQISLSASPAITKRMDTLHEAGVEFIMDDFGMGHSSMMYLKNNRFSYVKLDGSIVKDLLKNDRISNIVISIKQLSQSLGFDIIAEYVEEEEQRRKLEELGCHIYQGWLYSKAVDTDELERFLKKYGAIRED